MFVWIFAKGIWKIKIKILPEQIQQGINSIDFWGTAHSVNITCSLSHSRFNGHNKDNPCRRRSRELTVQEESWVHSFSVYPV